MKVEVRVETRRTCQISAELPQVSVEVIEPDLRGQEDVLRFRKREHALVCASILFEHSQTHKHKLRIQKGRSGSHSSRSEVYTECK